MPYSYSIQRRDGYLLLVASGAIDTMEDLILASRLINETAAQENCRRLLIDERAVTKDIDPHDLILYADKAGDRPRTGMRVAMLCSPEDFVRLRWIETILRNRSMSYRQFSSMEEAEQWLMRK